MCLRVFVFNSKIETLKAVPVSEEKTAAEKLSHKNGDVRHSTEKLPNGPEAATSKSAKTHASTVGFLLLLPFFR